MKVTIEHSEGSVKTGWLKKEPVYEVTLTLSLSEVEEAVVDQYRLRDLEVYKVDTPLGPSSVFLDKLLKEPHVRGFRTAVDAKAFEHELRETILPQLKHYLNVTAAPQEKKSSFEL